MDSDDVRKHAEAHAQATVAGDLRTAAQDLTDEGRAQAGSVMKQMPSSLSGAEVDSVEVQGDQAVARIRYSGEGGDVTVESTWAERDGRAKIVGLRVV